MARQWLISVVLFTNYIIISSGAPADLPEAGVDKVDDNIQETPHTALINNVLYDENNVDNGLLQAQTPRGLVVDGDINDNTVSSEVFTAQVMPSTEGGKCVTKVTVKGPGIDEKLAFPCLVGGMSTYISNEDVLVAGTKDTIQSNSVYSDKAGQLQVIMEGKCSLRTYTTTDGKITASSSPVTGAECDAMKKQHLERLQKWEQWKAEKFPSCFPFCNSAKPKPLPSLVGNGFNSPWNWNPYTNAPNPYVTPVSSFPNAAPASSFPNSAPASSFPNSAPASSFPYAAPPSFFPYAAPYYYYGTPANTFPFSSPSNFFPYVTPSNAYPQFVPANNNPSPSNDPVGSSGSESVPDSIGG